MIGEGIKVLMIVNLDSDSGSACLKKAADAGVQSIDYDRLTLGGGASYYVSSDNEKVGELMGTGLIAALDAEGKTKANITYVNGAATDNNAALFKSGYEPHSRTRSAPATTPSWATRAVSGTRPRSARFLEQMLTDNKGKIDGAWVVANDTMAGGVIARLKPAGLAGKIPTTGQDASVEGLQNILLGYQAGTVYKNTNLEADAASKLAIAG
ncbi:MAG: substrate-binding domain-containing protein [Nocardioides sp.]